MPGRPAPQRAWPPGRSRKEGLMKNLRSHKTALLGLALAVLTVVALTAAACGDDDGDGATPTEGPTATIQVSQETDTPQATDTTPASDAPGNGETISIAATAATITVDGDTSDWSGIEGVTVSIEQLRLDDLDPVQVEDLEIEFGPLDPIDVTLKVATDADNVYVLMEVPDDYDFDPEDHNLSAAIAVQFLIDQEATVLMGAPEEDLEDSLGVVDIWHWELDCGPGEIAGGGGVLGGDDATCNFDDEYAPNPEDREDDGEGDNANAAAENSLIGVWEHTGRAGGTGADGTWIFEMSRPLDTGDPQDTLFVSGGAVKVALAYFDADETLEGWTDAGHLVSAYEGWIEVTLP